MTSPSVAALRQFIFQLLFCIASMGYALEECVMYDGACPTSSDSNLELLEDVKGHHFDKEPHLLLDRILVASISFS